MSDKVSQSIATDFFLARIFALTHERTDLNEVRRLLQGFGRLRSRFGGNYERLDFTLPGDLEPEELLEMRSRHLELLELIARSGLLQFLAETAPFLMNRQVRGVPVDCLRHMPDEMLWEAMAARATASLPHDGGRSHVERVPAQHLSGLLVRARRDLERPAWGRGPVGRAIAASGKIATGGFFAAAHIAESGVTAMMASVPSCALHVATRAVRVAAGIYVGLSAAHEGWRDLATLLEGQTQGDPARLPLVGAGYAGQDVEGSWSDSALRTSCMNVVCTQVSG